jgi:tellurite resistance protein
VCSALRGSDLVETTYRVAAAVAFVDGRLDPAEAAALDAIAAALAIAADRAEALRAEVRAELFGG